MLPEIQCFPQTANKMTVTSIKYVFLHGWSAKSKTLPTNIGFVFGLGCLQRYKVSPYCKIDFRQNSKDSSWVWWECLFPMDYLSYTICCYESSQRWETIKNPTQLWWPWTRMTNSPKYSWRCKSGSQVSTVTKSCINGLLWSTQWVENKAWY